jgi:hypothetical protein
MYSFSVYSSPITFPFCFAVHTWVVLESPEFGVKRYEIHKFINRKTGNYFYTNVQAPSEGMPFIIIPRKFVSKARFKSKCIFNLKGDQAKEIVENIESRITNYSYLNKYHLYPGPNSNTFTRWILNLNEATKDVKLPWNAFGKNYK